MAAREFEAFKTIPPDETFAKDNLQLVVKYIVTKKFTVILCLKETIKGAWKDGPALAKIIEQEEFKYGRQNSVLIEKQNSLIKMAHKISDED